MGRLGRIAIYQRMDAAVAELRERLGGLPRPAEAEDIWKAMRKADQGDYRSMGELLARSITENLYRFVIPAVAGPVKLVPLAALITDDYTEDALRGAATRGRLRAVKGDDGKWRSSKVWVEQYHNSRYQRASKP